jgi:hypothetical protein
LFSPDERGYFPHMLPGDVELWNRFLDEHGHEYVGFRYDVHVGGAIERESKWTDKVHQMASWLVSKRIDAVGYRPGVTVIFEVKPEAGVTAVGQLVTYRMLFLEKYPVAGEVQCALVCSNILPDERRVLVTQGFGVFVV